MAAPEQVLENPVCGERVTFESVSDDELVMLVALRTGGARGPAHRQPAQEERYEVLSGAIVAEVGDAPAQTLRAGDVLAVAPGVRHRFTATDDAEARITFRPALRWAAFVERLFAGEDPAALLREFSAEIRV